MAAFSIGCGENCWKPCAQEVGKQPHFGIGDYLVDNPAVAALFDRTMAGVARHRHAPAVEAYDFDRFKTIVDVGGGNGALLAEILKLRWNNPKIRASRRP